MTLKEAIEFLKTVTGYFKFWNQAEQLKAAVAVVEKALNKQIPKKPVLKLHENRVQGEQEEYYCPCCDEWITWDFKWDYCAKCGQAIDWSE